MGGTASQPVLGREAQHESFREFLDAVREGPAALVLQGEPGIGKTVLWRDWLETASPEFRILSSRPVESEARLSFGALDDLLEGVLDQTLPALAGPKRHALEVALLRADPGERPPDRRTVSRAVLDVVRLLARERPLVLAVDDVQWLDLPSARVIEFVARRLEEDHIGILLARRIVGGDDEPVPLGLHRALPEERLRVVDLGPLAMGSIHEMLRSRLGTNFPRHVLVRIYEQSGGNPFFALEIARTLLAEDELPAPGEPLPVPDTLRALLRRRLIRLSPQAKDLLVSAAALSQPTIELVGGTEGAESSPLQEAADAGVIQIEDRRVRFTHPLHASVAYAEASASTRRAVHLRLAAALDDPEQRARHLALAATGPDEAIATTLDESARAAAARGAPDAAAILSEEAHRLTPPDDEAAAHRRHVEAADYHFRAGDPSRARQLLEGVLERMTSGPDRAWVLYRLGVVGWYEASWAGAEKWLMAALVEAGDDLSLLVPLHNQLATTRLVAGELGDAIDHSRVAASLSRRVKDDPRLQAAAQGSAAWFEFLEGHGADWDLLESAEGSERAAGPEPVTPMPQIYRGLALGTVLKYTDDFDSARAKLVGRYREAVDTGDESLLPFILYHLSELECWAGNWDAAEQHAEEGHKVALQSEQEVARSAVLYSRALVAAHRGLTDPARADAQESLGLSQRSGNVPVMTLALSVLGFLEVSLGDFDRAHEHLGPTGEALAAMGVKEPGIVRFLPDEIESLIALGNLDQATVLVDQLEERGRALDRIWALATGARCRALLDAANGDLEAADKALQRALKEHQRLPMPFELGRTLLVAGTIYRRAKQKRRAKESLQQAVEVFEGLGAPLWADKARHELARVGLRPPAPLELTESEHRVAELVAAGYTNRQVADALFISPKTVDSNLSRIYRKLGVRSRTELAAKLSSAGEPASS